MEQVLKTELLVLCLKAIIIYQANSTSQPHFTHKNSIMIARIIFFAAVSAATLAVILLALVSPLPKKKSPENRPEAWLALSLYVQPPHLPNPRQQATLHAHGAFIFRHQLTEGPKNTSRLIGRAQGFVVPTEHLALSAFNIIHLTFDTPEHAGSVSVEATRARRGTAEELTVVGGTGSFAFARGIAVFAGTRRWPSDAEATYSLKLRLRLPGESRGIQG